MATGDEQPVAIFLWGKGLRGGPVSGRFHEENGLLRGMDMASDYDFKALERKWRPRWEAMDLYKTGDDPEKPKYYILDFFPYPSGDGLSVGHCRNYVPTCVSARYMRMKGYNVLHPMGWDAFGLPAENYAIERGIHPRITTGRHADTYRRQMKLVECSYDWSREFSSTDPEFYRWTQWFFLLLYKRGLAYQAMGSQWWCPKDKTILANEQVISGRCWRCNTLVTKKELKQWYFKITDYADRLLADLDAIDWPEAIKLMQRNWIGRSEGAEVVFAVAAKASEVLETSEVSETMEIRTFTTRPDTLFGVTFMVLAPEHPLTMQLATAGQRAEVEAYVANALRMLEMDRLAEDKEKSGVFTGSFAIHPLTGEKIPIWVAEYVLMGYGSGAVMGVPAHDARDFAFARKYGLPISEVISPDGSEQGTESCYSEQGIMINSGAYNGLASQEGGRLLTADLASRGLGGEQVTYRMRDWLISRQRYWGAPIPIIHCAECGPVAVPDADLPVRLPDIDDFNPTGDGRSPLARVEGWVGTTCPECDGPARRETDTMDGFACSSWYFLRFTSPHYEDGPFEPKEMNYWSPADTYVGGAEHAVMHLLYARFWTKVMYDAGLVPFDEPFPQLRNQGVLHAADGQRMSKSKGNVVTPDEVVAEHGTDALRAYILFIGPFDGDVIWSDSNIKGVDRFLEKFWKLAYEMEGRGDAEGRWESAGGQAEPRSAREVERAFRRRMHLTIQRITDDFERFKFNTAVAALMEYLNYLTDQRDESIPPALWREALEAYTRLLSPIAPFIAEEVWQEVLGHAGESVHQSAWPEFDKALTVAEEITLMIQVNGKLRDKVTVPADIDEDALREVVLAREKVQQRLDGRTVRKTIIVPKRLVNVVIQ
jgi:leucyl-tRNA synthetase